METLFDKLQRLYNLLRYSSSFLDRVEGVGIITKEQARSYGLVGPVARASGVARDLRRVLPYAAYAEVSFEVPREEEGDGYARLRVLFREAEQSVHILRKVLAFLPKGETVAPPGDFQAWWSVGLGGGPGGPLGTG